ncbi:MAG: protein kinase [Deltaproteobacteria bacterium]|nr:protein kinase [Deltaproteobacteria bacterium]
MEKDRRLLPGRKSGPIANADTLPARANCEELAKLAVLGDLAPMASGSTVPTVVELGRSGPSQAMRSFPLVDPMRYQVVREVARGGLGRILEARDHHLGRNVAIKELLKGDSTAEARFVREATVTARLQHPAIVPVHDVGRWPTGEPFYAMKMVSGRSFDEVIKGTRALGDRLALLPNVIAVAEAIAYAHSKGVIHRDLKPANILIGSFGETVVIDWGIAKTLAEINSPDPTIPPSPAGEEGMTAVGMVMGTPSYMPPEQARGHRVDERADVYALGAILYHVLAGMPPYSGSQHSGTQSGDILSRVITGPPKPLSSRQPGVPRDLLTIVNKAMAREPMDRYPNAAELADDLKRFQHGQLVNVHDYSTLELMERWFRRHKAPMMVALVALAIVLASAAVSVARIVRERDHSQKQRAVAERAKKQADARASELILMQASHLLDQDPTAAIAWLKQYPATAPSWERARQVAADARSRGVARHVLRGHTGSIWSVAVSPDGSSIASASADRTVRLWDEKTAKSRVLGVHDGEVNSVAFSPDGALLASAGDDRVIRLWDVRTGSARVLGGHESGVAAVAFSPDGKTLASGSFDETIRLWDLESGQSRILAEGQPMLHLIAFSPDGLSLASTGSDSVVRIWNLATGEQRLLLGHEGSVAGVAFSPDGRLLASGSEDKTVALWDLESGERRVFRHKSRVWGVAFSPDGETIASASRDKVVRLWDIATGEARELLGHQSYAWGVAFSPSGHFLASSSEDGTVRIWAMGPRSSRLLMGHEGAVRAARFLDGNRLVTGGEDGSVRAWDVSAANGRVLGTHEARVLYIVHARDDRHFATASDDGTVRLWDSRSGKGEVIGGFPGAFGDVVYSPDGARLAFTDTPRSLRVHEVQGKTTRSLVGYNEDVHFLVFSPDGKSLASASGNEIWLWDMVTDTPRVLKGHAGWIGEIAFSPDGMLLASSSNDQTIRLWDLRGGTSQALHGHTGSTSALAFSPDGKVLASVGADQTLMLWSLEQGRVKASRPLHVPPHLVRALSFSPTGRILAGACEDKNAWMWDVATGDSIPLMGHEDEVWAIDFSPDGKLLATASADGTVRAWFTDVVSFLPAEATGLKARLEEMTSAVIDQLDQLGTPY